MNCANTYPLRNQNSNCTKKITTGKQMIHILVRTTPSHTKLCIVLKHTLSDYVVFRRKAIPKQPPIKETYFQMNRLMLNHVSSSINDFVLQLGQVNYKHNLTIHLCDGWRCNYYLPSSPSCKATKFNKSQHFPPTCDFSHVDSLLHQCHDAPPFPILTKTIRPPSTFYSQSTQTIV